MEEQTFKSLSHMFDPPPQIVAPFSANALVTLVTNSLKPYLGPSFMDDPKPVRYSFC